MKLRLLIVNLIAIFCICGHAPAAPTPEQMQVLIRNRPELDEIRWKDSERPPLKVRIVEASGQTLTVEKTLMTGLAVRKLPFSELSGLTFSFTAREQALHRQPAPASIPPLKVLWDRRQATLSQPGSNVAETGLALAKSLRLTGISSSLVEAGGILDQIRAQDTLQHRKDRARDEQVVVDFILSMQGGNHEQTDALAWQITEHPDNVDAMLLATAFLASRHFSELKVIEDANPRWVEDDEIRPIRERLYQLSLDFALYPSLFAGTRETEASVGLKLAAEIHQFSGSNNLLKNTLEDLAALYPKSAAATETSGDLLRLRQLEAAGKLSLSTAITEEEKTDNESSEEGGESTSTGPPPPPKRYNIFGD